MKDKKTNFLILFTDQQRYDTIRACGNKHMLTPNLDRLVKEGKRFENAYSPNPVCIPARHNLLTGLSARYHGFPHNCNKPVPYYLPTLPQILSDNGYDTRAIGKMHFRPVRRHNGFNNMELMEEIPVFRENDEYAMYLKEVGLENIQNIHGVRNLLYMLPQRSLIPEEHHGSTWVADRSIKYLKENIGKRPFFLWSSWIAPHPPFDVPDTFSELYNDIELPEPLKSKTEISQAAKNSCRHGDFPEGQEDDYIRRIRQLYYSAISMVDKNIGRILDTLEECGELDNTFIIFCSDHGEMLGDHSSYQKMLPYDSCSKIPFIVRYPKQVKAGSVCREFADLNDILPTILDVAGIDYPGSYELPGGSIFTKDKDRSCQYMEFGSEKNRWCSIRNQQFKFNYYYGGGCEELFDMENDPDESTNLLAVDSEKYTAVRDEMYSLLCKYESRWGLEGYATEDGMSKYEENPPHCSVKNGQFPVFPDNIINEDEKNALNDFGFEVTEAVKDESLVNLHKLSLDDWLGNGAPLETVNQIKEQKL